MSGLTGALQAATGIEKIELPFSTLMELPDVLRASDFEVQCVIAQNKEHVFVYDVFEKSANVVAAGLAIDIGTTTVSAVMVDMLTGRILAKASSGNGQIRYGADVINRIIESQKPGGHKKLQDAIIDETLNPMIQQMSRAAGLSSRSDLPAVRGRQLHHEPSAVGYQRRSIAYGALYSGLL